MRGKWIWVSPVLYPDLGKNKEKYCVASFKKNVALKGIPKYVELKMSGDTYYRLFVNGEFVTLGPACAGGDFLTQDKLDWYYADKKNIEPKTDTLQIYAQVQFPDQVLTEFSYGLAGFLLEGRAVYEDGSTEEFISDSTWLAQIDKRYPAPCTYDETMEDDAWTMAYETGDERVLTDSPVKQLVYENIYPNDKTVVVSKGVKRIIEFNRIYSAYIGIEADGPCELLITLKETANVGSKTEKIKFAGAGFYRSFRMHSVGEMHIEAISAYGDVTISPMLFFSHYPIESEGKVITDNADINAVYDMCKWALNICRQSIHLDSPMHQELLACTGDYYIETLMTVFTYGDMSLSKADVMRTANWLVQNDGRMFHTTYSLIWVQMLKLVYEMTGDKALLSYCRPAMNALLERFYMYCGKNGIVDTPPDYMFVDWMVVDGYSMHHPPKYLGQTVLNAFYYKALNDSVYIGNIMGWDEIKTWSDRAAVFKQAFNEAFYDENKGLYFDGLSDFEPDMGQYSPENPNRRAYTRYPNILAPLYGLAEKEDAVRLIRLMADDNNPMQPIQPYFMNYLMEAVVKYDLYEEIGLELIGRWIPSVKACPKGLQEGWYKPQEDYSFDHSHAWGGCPAYFIPQMITGFRMEEPGFKKISFLPKLCGIKNAFIKFPTPYGMIEFSIAENGNAEINVPKEIAWYIR